VEFSLAALVITLVLAARVMFWSSDASVYEANRDIFYRYGFVCTILYFVFAYELCGGRGIILKSHEAGDRLG
jgi:hypothetical protein